MLNNDVLIFRNGLKISNFPFIVVTSLVVMKKRSFKARFFTHDRPMDQLTRSKPNLTDEEAQRLLADLLDQSSMVNGKRVLASGAVRNVAKKFKLSERSVRRQWKKALDRREKEGFYSCTSLKQGNSGRKQLYNREELMEAMEQVPGHERGNLRSLANSLGVGLKTVWMLKMDEKIIHPHTNAIKPFLTDENKLHRIAYAADHVITVNGGSFYDGMYNEIHVDEKWFFISKETQRDKERKEMVTILSENVKASGI